MDRWRLFVRLFVRPLAAEPVRTALTAFAVALGVAVVLAIDLAGQAAAGSFRSSVETLVGAADFQLTAVGGVPAEVFARVATLPYPLTIWPRVEDSATLSETGETVPLIGIDTIADAGQSMGGDKGLGTLTDPESVW